MRRGVLLALLFLGLVAVGQLVLTLQAFSSAAFMLQRAQTSNRQLSAYQLLSIDLLEYIRIEQSHSPTVDFVERRQAAVTADLTTLDMLVRFEVALVRENGGNEGDEPESRRLQRIHFAIERLMASPAASTAGVYEDDVKPMLVEAVAGEQAEVEDVLRSMKALQASMRAAGPMGVLLQLAAAGLVIGLVSRLVLNPLARLVADRNDERTCTVLTSPRHFDDLDLLRR